MLPDSVLLFRASGRLVVPRRALIETRKGPDAFIPLPSVSFYFLLPLRQNEFTHITALLAIPAVHTLPILLLALDIVELM
jgi:hypothetical protein